MKPSVSVVVPVYNAEQTLRELVGKLLAVLAEAAGDHEIILVNDGSRDQSWTEIASLSQEHRSVRGIDLLRNYGQHNALLAGIRAARHEVIVTLDDDLQHPPAEIPKLLAKLDEGYDVVYGYANVEPRGFLRGIASRATKLVLQGVMGPDTARHITSFRAFRAAVRSAFESFRGPFVSIDVLLTWGTTRFVGLRVQIDARRHGISNYDLGKLIVHTFNLVTGFSTLPLRFASLVGFAFTLMGGIVLLYVLVNYLVRGGKVPGFSFIASIIAIFSGAQLFAIGMIGEYLARAHFRIMDKPPYAVRHETASQAESQLVASAPRAS